jgi:hypothetical protein
MRLRVLILLLLLLVAPPFAVAASAPDFNGIAYEQKPGAQIPVQDIFRDDTGRMVRLDDLFEAVGPCTWVLPLPKSLQRRSRRLV